MLEGWDINKCIQLRLDHTKVAEDLTDFPVLINLGATSGQNSYDATALFDELSTNASGTDSYLNRKKIAIYDTGYQEHVVETVDDIFTGTDNDSANPILWTTYGTSSSRTVEIHTNKLRMSNDGTTAGGQGIYSNYLISGDFDIQVDLTTIADTATQIWFPRIIATASTPVVTNVDSFGASMRYETGQKWWYGESTVSTSWQNYNIATSDMYGKLRLVRNGTTGYCYYWDGSNWVLIHSRSSISTADMYIIIQFATTVIQGSPITFDFDNFKLNYGTINWNGNAPYYITKTYTGTPQQCYCEIENWDQANQEAQLWVKVPKVLYDQPTDLYLYYDATQSGNSTYIGDTDDVAAQNVWDSNFSAVYHMAKDPTRPFTPKVLYSGETSGSSSTAAVAARSFTAINYTGLTKSNGVLKIDLKVNNTNYIDNSTNCQLEITSSAGPDTEEWNYTMDVSYDPLGIAAQLDTTYKTFYMPLSYFGTSGGELVVNQIDYLRWYMKAVNGTLIIYWRNAEIVLLEDTVLDSTQNSNSGSGTNLSSSNLVAGPIGNGLDVSTTRITVPHDASLDASSALTVDFSCKPDTSTGDYACVVGKRSTTSSVNYEIYFNATSRTLNWANGSGYSSTFVPTINTVYHITVSCDGSTVYFYINGSLYTTIAAGFGATNTEPFYIGAIESPYTQYYEGILDEIRVSTSLRSEYWTRANYYSNSDNLITYTAAPIFNFTGTVQVNGEPKARKVHLYRRATGELVGSAWSDSVTGVFNVYSPYNELHFVNILPELTETFNLLSYDKIDPSA